MTDEQFNCRCAEADGWKQTSRGFWTHETDDPNWRRYGQFPDYANSIEDMLRVCRKMGWEADLYNGLGIGGTYKHKALVCKNIKTSSWGLSEADTPTQPL